MVKTKIKNINYKGDSDDDVNNYKMDAKTPHQINLRHSYDF